MIRSRMVLIFIIVLIAGLTLLAIDKSPGRVRSQKISSPVKIDGLLAEPAWQVSGISGFTQSDPKDGAAASEKTEVWVAYDRTSLYVAVRLYDSKPSEIVGRLGRRDDLVDSDWFIISIDPYFDRRSGYKFAVNPSGSIMDWTLFNDEEEDLSWDGIWSSAARIDEKGWTVEIRIPFHQLRFKKAETSVWGINFHRVIKRKNETASYAWVPKEDGGYVSRFAVLEGLSGIHSGRTAEFLPYLAAQALFRPAESGNPYQTGSEYRGDAGLDVKVGLRSDLTLDLSFNPDFGQVEVDPAVINISDRETYYQEKRPFFIEGAGIFRFGGGGLSGFKNYGWRSPIFFYSRRVGRSPQGRIHGSGYVDMPDWASILEATKLTGKIGKDWNIGFISALTNREFASIHMAGLESRQEVEPLTHSGVIRVQKEFRQGRQGLGFIFSSLNRNFKSERMEKRLASDAFTLGLDGWSFLDRDKIWVISGWLGTTRVTGSTAAITRLQNSSLHYFQRPDADYVTVNEGTTVLNGWAGRLVLNKQKGNVIFNAAVGAISPGFNTNELGYHNRGDTINGQLAFGYQSFHPGKIFRQWKLAAAGYLNYDFGGNRVGENYYLSAEAQLLNYWSGSLNLNYEPEKMSHYFTRGGPMLLYLSGADIRYSISSDNRKALVYSLGGHYRWHPNEAYNWSLKGGFRWKPSRNFSLSISSGYMYRRSTGQWIQRIMDPLKLATFGYRYVFSDIHQKTLPIEIRLNWTFNPRLSLQAYIQPYIAVGDYFRFKELVAPYTFHFIPYGQGNSTLSYENGIFRADPDGPGPAPSFSFFNPDFNYKSLRGTVVLRWEYRPGSALYLVWTQNRSDYSHPGDLRFGRDIQSLFAAPGDNLFLLKFTYRFTL